MKDANLTYLNQSFPLQKGPQYHFANGNLFSDHLKPATVQEGVQNILNEMRRRNDNIWYAVGQRIAQAFGLQDYQGPGFLDNIANNIYHWINGKSSQTQERGIPLKNIKEIFAEHEPPPKTDEFNYALYKKDTALVSALLSKGVDPFAKNNLTQNLYFVDGLKEKNLAPIFLEKISKIPPQAFPYIIRFIEDEINKIETKISVTKNKLNAIIDEMYEINMEAFNSWGGGFLRVFMGFFPPDDEDDELYFLQKAGEKLEQALKKTTTKKQKISNLWQKLIKKGLPISQKHYAKTPIEFAIECGDIDFVQTLIEHSTFKMNQLDAAGNNLLEKALKFCQFEIVELLKKQGLKTDTPVIVLTTDSSKNAMMYQSIMLHLDTKNVIPSTLTASAENKNPKATMKAIIEYLKQLPTGSNRAQAILNCDIKEINEIKALAKIAFHNADAIWVGGGPNVWEAWYNPQYDKLDAEDIYRDILEIAVLDLQKKDVYKPLLGVCRGHQMINVFYGGTLKDKGQSDVNPLKVTKQHGILGSAFPTQTQGWSGHHQSIEKLADILEAVATAETDMIKAIQSRVSDLPLMGTQFHPEYSDKDKLLQNEILFNTNRKVLKRFLNTVEASKGKTCFAIESIPEDKQASKISSEYLQFSKSLQRKDFATCNKLKNTIDKSKMSLQSFILEYDKDVFQYLLTEKLFDLREEIGNMSPVNLALNFGKLEAASSLLAALEIECKETEQKLTPLDLQMALTLFNKEIISKKLFLSLSRWADPFVKARHYTDKVFVSIMENEQLTMPIISRKNFKIPEHAFGDIIRKLEKMAASIRLKSDPEQIKYLSKLWKKLIKSGLPYSKEYYTISPRDYAIEHHQIEFIKALDGIESLAHTSVIRPHKITLESGPRKSKKHTQLSQKKHKRSATMVNKPERDLDKGNHKEETRLIKAAENSDLETVRELLNHKDINPNAEDKYGDTPLKYAALYGESKIARALLDHKDIDPNLMDKEGGTPLFYATLYNQSEIVDALLNHPEIDPNLADQDGETPIFCAVRDGDVECVAQLLNDFTLNPFMECDNKSVFDLVPKTAKEEIAKLLKPLQSLQNKAYKRAPMSFDEQDKELEILNKTRSFYIYLDNQYKKMTRYSNELKVRSMMILNNSFETPTSLEAKTINQQFRKLSHQWQALDKVKTHFIKYLSHKINNISQFNEFQTTWDKVLLKTSGEREKEFNANLKAIEKDIENNSSLQSQSARIQPMILSDKAAAKNTTKSAKPKDTIVNKPKSDY